MMTLGMSEERYDVAGNNILYGKLFDKLVEDFLTREDAKKMMEATNLSVSTTVMTGVQVVIPAGTGTGTGTGNGQVTATYKGEFLTRSTGARLLEAKRKREKLTGTTETEGSLEAINTAAGGELG